MPSLEHEQFVAALRAGGSVLTPRSLPSSEVLQEMGALEGTVGFAVPADTTVTTRRYGADGP